MPTVRAPLRPLVLVPARLGATRLPMKPLADIHGEPMIVHVWRRACEAAIGRVIVATDAPEIADAVVRAGGEAVMTRADHASGSDRVFEAVESVDPRGAFEIVVNVQGDLPTLDPAAIRACLGPLADPAVDIATLVAVASAEERDNPNVVKAVLSPKPGGGFRALLFTRSAAPWGEGPLYHHIGLYAYRRAALARFVGLPPSPLELRERLEQLRALEAGMRIDAAEVALVPLGVDTPEDLARARALLSSSLAMARALPSTSQGSLSPS